MKPTTAALVLSVSLLHWAHARRADAAFLEGKAISVLLFNQTESSVPQTLTAAMPVVGPGVELTNFGARLTDPMLPPLANIDVSDSQILITAVQDQRVAFKDVLEFTDPLGVVLPFGSASINPATNWTGFNASRIAFNPNSVELVLTGLSGLTGQQILLDLAPAAVPEPVSAVPLAIACTAVAIFRRRAA
jgi:hypothetical protein